MKVIQVKNFIQWRIEARALLAQNTPPSQVSWSTDLQTQLFFSSQTPPSNTVPSNNFKVPAQFIKLARAAACYREDCRWSLLYSVLWRMNHEEPHLLNMVTDTEVRKLKHMYQAVHRDAHKMHAFVRFNRKLVKHQEWYVAWFEPSHLIVEYTADFFVKRFNTMNWSILTPDACAHWDQNHLKITEGVDKTEFKAQDFNDDMNDYWRQYYRHIFNPARLKTQAMQSEMPKKYWHNLPEAELINELSQQSGQRVSNMIDNPSTDPNRLRNKSKRLRQQQDGIRNKQR